MANALGLKTKAAFRVAPADGVDINNANYIFPTSVANATSYMQATLGTYDQLPYSSEGIEDERDFELDETLEGSPSISEVDLVSSKINGSIQAVGKYMGLDALIACAMGMEIPGATDSPSFPNATALTAGTCAVGTFVANASVFAAGDVGKFITITSGTGKHQVRRISAYTSGTSVSITPNWDVTPTAADTASMNISFKHKFELSKQLNVETFSDVYSGYDTTGVLTATDKIARFGTLGFQKQVTDWVHRAVMVNTMDFTLSANQSLSMTFGLMGYDLIKGSYHATTWSYSPSGQFSQNKKIIFKDSTLYLKAYSTNSGFSATDAICANELTFNLNNNLNGDDQDFCSGTKRTEPARTGFRQLGGTISIPRYANNDFVTWRDNQTKLMLKLEVIGEEIETGQDFEMVIWMPTLKLVNGQPNADTAGKLTQTFDFTCIAPEGAASGFPTQFDTSNRGEMIIETKNMNPFNAFLNQNKEY